uniref:CCHC-type domain-containing protein n=1 Tax=Chenopodium quinoa TaxID=63459 RepID=A0A803LVP7_CHEQI
MVMKDKVCFKCKGGGHIAAQCPSKALVSLEAQHAFLLVMVEEEEEITNQVEFEGPLDEAASDDNVLVIRFVLYVTPTQEKHREQRENLFQSHCMVKGRSCSLIIDGGSCTNIDSKEMVDTLGLEQQDHPKPYKINWVNNDGGLLVKKRVLVQFEIGEFKDEVWCDVLPMDSCSLLLGRPWQWDRDATHLWKQNIYTIAVGNSRIGLQPLAPKYMHASEESVINSASKDKEKAKIDSATPSNLYISTYNSLEMNKKGRKAIR